MHPSTFSVYQQEPVHGSPSDMTGIILEEDTPPRLEDQTQITERLHSEPFDYYSKYFSAGLGPLCLRFDTQPDGKVQSTDLVLRLGTDSQATITVPGPFEDEETAEDFALWKVLSEGILHCLSSPTTEPFAITPAHPTIGTTNFYSRMKLDEPPQFEFWDLVNNGEVDQLEDLSPEAPGTTTIEAEEQLRSRSPSPCTHTSLSDAASLYSLTKLPNTTPATFPPLFTTRYQHLPPNPYAPPLQCSYGPPLRSGLSRPPTHSESKVIFLTSPQELQRYRIEPFSSENPISTSVGATDCIHRSSQNGESHGRLSISVPARSLLRTDPGASKPLQSNKEDAEQHLQGTAQLSALPAKHERHQLKQPIPRSLFHLALSNVGIEANPIEKRR
ncbi:hypothetical protein FRC01_001678 [Tulasnella sp. 417]|nr:hypothetical protein FRC01_001678 [Tulasnella sp. 417]